MYSEKDYQDFIDAATPVLSHIHALTSSIHGERFRIGALKEAETELAEVIGLAAHAHEDYIIPEPQFKASLKLAGRRGHHWASVIPDDMRSLQAIHAYALENADSMPGINAPYVDSKNTIVHETNSGRLEWEILPNGNGSLTINRPPWTLPYQEYQSYLYDTGYQAGAGIVVAKVNFINDNDEKWLFPVDVEDNVEIVQYLHGDKHFPKGKIQYHLLCERHVQALASGLVDLYLVEDQGYTLPDRDDAKYQQGDNGYQLYRDDCDAARLSHRERVISPAYARINAILQPLYDIALPDPIDTDAWDFDEEKLEEQTWWENHKFREYDHRRPVIHHHGYKMTVESERVACHAVLWLKRAGEAKDYLVQLRHAVRVATESFSYRPHFLENEYGDMDVYSSIFHS